MTINRGSLDIYSHGVPPYKKRNTILFVTNESKTKLFILYENCRYIGESLLHDAIYYESNNVSYLNCKNCLAHEKRDPNPLKSTIDYKIVDENDDIITDENEYINGILKIKLDIGVLKNTKCYQDINGYTPLYNLLNFYCINEFRRTYPIKPQNIQDLWVLTEFKQYGSYNENNSP